MYKFGSELAIMCLGKAVFILRHEYKDEGWRIEQPLILSFFAVCCIKLQNSFLSPVSRKIYLFIFFLTAAVANLFKMF